MWEMMQHGHKGLLIPDSTNINQVNDSRLSFRELSTITTGRGGKIILRIWGDHKI